MLKKNIRERKEYLYKRQEEIKSKLIQDKKDRLKKDIERNTDNNNDINDLENSGKANAFYKKNKHMINIIEADDMETQLPYNLMDDEYKSGNYREPKVLITTSRSCSNRLHQFMQEMRIIIPNSYKLNRGNLVIKDLVQIAKEKEFTDIILLHENRGQPDGLILTHLPYGPTIYFGLYNVVLRHDIREIGTVSEAYPHLVFDGFNSKLGNRVTEILKNIFPIPKLDSNKVMSFACKDDVISFRHHSFNKKNKSIINNLTNIKADNECRPDDVELVEHGPRFDMMPYQITLGTVDIQDAQKEWVIRPYINTAKKNNVL
jgi:U3 small nucleolar ribonucleoprotein protein IMP4